MRGKLITGGLVVMILGAGAGIHYRIPIIVALVCVGLALFSATTGLTMLLSRTAIIPVDDSMDAHAEHHTGLSAQLWGVLFLIFSVPLGAIGIGYWRYGGDPPTAIVEQLARAPIASGLAIVVTGAAVILYGLTRLLPAADTFSATGLGRLERGATGTYLVAAGSLVAAAGVVRAVAPGTLTRMRDGTISWLLALVR